MAISLHSQSVNVDRLKLLAILKSNRTKHVKAYLQSLIDYRAAIQGDLETAVLQAKDPNFDILRLNVEFDAPQSYEREYTNVIDLLEASVDKVINLDSSAFQAYYKDNWSWKARFETSNSLYATKAVSVSGRVGNVTIGGSANKDWPFPRAVSGNKAAEVAVAAKRPVRKSK